MQNLRPIWTRSEIICPSKCLDFLHKILREFEKAFYAELAKQKPLSECSPAVCLWVTAEFPFTLGEQIMAEFSSWVERLPI